MSQLETKRALRESLLEARAQIPGAARAGAGEKVAGRVAAVSEYKMAEVVAAFAAFGGEIDTGPLMARILADGKTLVLPKVADGKLTLHRVDDPETRLAPGAMGIPEPQRGCRKVAASRVNLFLVPGVGFDLHGGRIGYGKGYYDQLLEKLSAPRAGLCFDVQVVARLPMDSHDVPMDMIITPSRTARCRVPTRHG